jgi:hypothetical protein
MIKDFKFFRPNNVKRFTKIRIDLITYPEDIVGRPDHKRTFRRGWRACEDGREVYDNPYANPNNLIYSLHRSWERGYIECYLNHPEKLRQHLFL